ncbi:histone-lysine N-methyltransferase SETDB2 isoform X8 [Rattus norvegicus]|uniref:histone-lysine N-methyltransferase SETDB2 isoform X8 n=1 Tax=Rattus norvegicus TaxID=10116 RepID=UPI001916EF43|nr:histone-lysine N-methyltransferase SETDB2 isoform X8 [Rattus norvegicus]
MDDGCPVPRTEDLSSSQVGYSEDKQLTESDVIDTTTSREDTSPAYGCKHAAILNSKNTKKVLEVPVKTSQEEEPAASQSQQVSCGEELASERTKIPSASLVQLSKESLFLLDASKEGNVGRFLNHSCYPNLWVQNVFVETHDRNFPLAAFFTNRYVKARTELTWDYGYEAGTMPEKEILCQCFCQVTEKMEKRTCVLCPEGHDWSVIYFSPSANIAAHENCLLYSSGLVECEAHDPFNIAKNFDVSSVLEKIWNGSTSKCSFCNNEGAIMGCDETSCAKNYHLLCAKEDRAILQVGVKRTYKIFCPEHPPQQEETTERANGLSIKKRRGRKKRRSLGPPAQPKTMKCRRSRRHVTGEALGQRDAAVKAPFLKKCLEAGLLTELFEQIQQKMISIHGRFMDETASESDYEGIETLVFGCGLFKDTLIKLEEAIKSKTCEYEERLNQMKQKLEALAHLQQNLHSFQECGDLDPSGSTSGSLLPPEDHQCRCQESPEVQAGSGDSL